MEYGAIDQTADEVDKHLTRASEALQKFQPCQARDVLDQVVTDLKQYTRNQVDNYRGYLQSSA